MRRRMFGTAAVWIAAGTMAACATLATVRPARADLPLVGPGGVEVMPLPAPPAGQLGRIIVTWNGGLNEAFIDNMPAVAPPAGSPVGTRAWAKVVNGIGTGAIVLKPVAGGTGWEISGVLLIEGAGEPKWTVPPQPWNTGLRNYQAHIIGDATVTALGRIDVGGGD